MKIRIKGNSIRYRLSKSEMDAFGKSGYIEDRTEFGHNLFIYALRRNPDATELYASFVGIKITMHVPPYIADEWTRTDEVGCSNTYTYDSGKQLSLLLEKDFKCIDAAVTEDQSDNYENPLHSCGPNENNAEQTQQVQHDVVEEQIAVHYELAEESLPGNIEEVVAPAFTPALPDDELTEEATEEEYPAVELPAHEAVTEALMIVDEVATDGSQAPEEEATGEIHYTDHAEQHEADERPAEAYYTAPEQPSLQPEQEEDLAAPKDASDPYVSQPLPPGWRVKQK